MTEQEYYNDQTLHGNYAYITLEQVVNDYLASRDQDDFTSKVPRFKIVYQAKRGIRELYYDVLQEIKAIELDLDDRLQVILPPDFVNYVRISIKNDDGTLTPLVQNKDLSISNVYLQDNTGALVFDFEGNIIQSGEILNTPSIQNNNSDGGICSYIFSPNLNMSNVFTEGSFRLDKDAGVIRFSSEVENKSVVLEYISDGIDEDETQIRVHKFAEEALSNFIYYQLIKRNRHISQGEKDRAKREYFNTRRIAKRRVNNTPKQEWIKAMSGVNVWNK